MRILQGETDFLRSAKKYLNKYVLRQGMLHNQTNLSAFTGLFHSNDYDTGYIVSYWINKLPLIQNLYSGAKHFPFFSKRPFHIGVYLTVLWRPFHVFTQTQYRGEIAQMVGRLHCIRRTRVQIQSIPF